MAEIGDEPKILQLPTEVLLEIFGYLPERWDVSLACQSFYEVVCKLEMNSLCLSVKDDNVCIDNRFHKLF